MKQLSTCGLVSILLACLLTIAVLAANPAFPASPALLSTIPVSDGFDYPVGDVNHAGYSEWQWLEPRHTNGCDVLHPGEDWNKAGTSDSDYGQPLYAISRGRVVDVRLTSAADAWGKVVLIEHVLPEGVHVWSQYAHLKDVTVTVGSEVNRRQQIGTIGDANGYYRGASGAPHLHFEIRIQQRGITEWPCGWTINQVLQSWIKPSDFIDRNRTIGPTQAEVGRDGPNSGTLSSFQDAYALNGGVTNVGSPDAWVYGYGPGNDGQAQNFKNGVGKIITESGVQNFPAYYIQGTILQKYESTRDGNGRVGPWSPLGWLASDEMEAAPSSTGTTGRLQRCQGGAIYYWRNGFYHEQAFEIHDDAPAGFTISRKYDELGGSDGNQHPDPDYRYDLGFPRSDTLEAATSPKGTTGGLVRFEGGVGDRGAAIYGRRGVGGTYVVYGRIHDKFEDLGGTDHRLGFPVADRQKAGPSRAGTGAEGVAQQFEGTDNRGRVIYWRRVGETWDSAAYLVESSMLDLYGSMGPGSLLGFPQGDVRPASPSGTSGDGGNEQLFEDGAIYDGIGGIRAVYGPIWARYRQSPWGPGSSLGYPKSAIDAVGPSPSPGNSSGVRQRFQAGSIWSSGRGTFVLLTWINDRFEEMGGPSSVLGFPTADRASVTSGVTSATGDFAPFEGGRMYHRGTDNLAYSVRSPILELYTANGGAAGAYGFPLGEPVQNGSVVYQDFEGGRLQPPTCSVALITPNGGETWAPGSPQSVTWSSTNLSGNVKLDYSTDGGSTWKSIRNSTPNDGSELWTVPSDPSANCRVRVSAVADASCNDLSNSPFVILPVASCTILVTTPNGGETVFGGSTVTVRWTSTGVTGNVGVDYSLDGGTGWISIISGTANSGQYRWTVPSSVQSTAARIRVRASGDASCSDVSNSNFMIRASGGRLKVNAAVNFGTVRVGSARDQLLMIKNISTTESLVVTLSDPAVPYQVAEADRSWTLQAGATVSVRLRFTPSARGKATRTVQISSTDFRRSQVDVKLQGKGK